MYLKKKKEEETNGEKHEQRETWYFSLAGKRRNENPKTVPALAKCVDVRMRTCMCLRTCVIFGFFATRKYQALEIGSII